MAVESHALGRDGGAASPPAGLLKLRCKALNSDGEAYRHAAVLLGPSDASLEQILKCLEVALKEDPGASATWRFSLGNVPCALSPEVFVKVAEAGLTVDVKTGKKAVRPENDMGAALTVVCVGLFFLLYTPRGPVGTALFALAALALYSAGSQLLKAPSRSASRLAYQPLFDVKEKGGAAKEEKKSSSGGSGKKKSSAKVDEALVAAGAIAFGAFLLNLRSPDFWAGKFLGCFALVGILAGLAALFALGADRINPALRRANQLLQAGRYGDVARLVFLNPRQ